MLLILSFGETGGSFGYREKLRPLNSSFSIRD
jgi:hypothetical protein